MGLCWRAAGQTPASHVGNAVRQTQASSGLADTFLPTLIAILLRISLVTMPAKRKSAKAVASADHLHPASAATAPSAASASKPTSGSSSSSSVSTVNGGNSSHVGAGKPPRDARPDPYANSGRTWNPIKLIERALFRTYWNIEATFVLSMLEAWEVFLVIVVFLTLTLLLWYSLIHYFPRHIQQVATRALYYVYGNSPPPQLAAVVTANYFNKNISICFKTCQNSIFMKY